MWVRGLYILTGTLNQQMGEGGALLRLGRHGEILDIVRMEESCFLVITDIEEQTFEGEPTAILFGSC